MTSTDNKGILEYQVVNVVRKIPFIFKSELNSNLIFIIFSADLKSWEFSDFLKRRESFLLEQFYSFRVAKETARPGHLEGWQCLQKDRITTEQARHSVLLCWSKNTRFARKCISSKPRLVLLLCSFCSALPQMPMRLHRTLLSFYRKQE